MSPASTPTAGTTAAEIEARQRANGCNQDDEAADWGRACCDGCLCLAEAKASAASLLHDVGGAVLSLDADGGWDHETTGGWPDAPTYRALCRAVEVGYAERSSAYGAMCWRLTDEGIQFRKELENGSR